MNSQFMYRCFPSHTLANPTAIFTKNHHTCPLKPSSITKVEIHLILRSKLSHIFYLPISSESPIYICHDQFKKKLGTSMANNSVFESHNIKIIHEHQYLSYINVSVGIYNYQFQYHYLSLARFESYTNINICGKLTFFVEIHQFQTKITPIVLLEFPIPFR